MCRADRLHSALVARRSHRFLCSLLPPRQVRLIFEYGGVRFFIESLD
jgi:hypothetical protein